MKSEIMNENNEITTGDIPEDLRDKVQESKNLVADIVVELLCENISEKEKEIKLLWNGIEIVRKWLKDNTKSVSDILSVLSNKSNAGNEVE